eukprot:scaffold4255_cov69-Cyclotella_meneghiniana.AAC.1
MSDTTTATAQPTEPPSKGINIQDALSILSARSKGGGENLASNSNSITEEMKEMGQTIDIVEQMEFTKPDSFCECSKNNNASREMKYDENNDDEKHEAMRQERSRRGEEIQSTLQSLNLSELLGTLFAAQEERVATYKVYDHSCSIQCSTFFAVFHCPTYQRVVYNLIVWEYYHLSYFMCETKTSLTVKHKRSDIAQAVGQLQKYECEKLNLTAAMHLEQLRLKNEELGLSFDRSDQASSRLLKEGIQNLERKIMSNVESINEVLDELRCVAAEENEV